MPDRKGVIRNVCATIFKAIEKFEATAIQITVTFSYKEKYVLFGIKTRELNFEMVRT